MKTGQRRDLEDMTAQIKKYQELNLDLATELETLRRELQLERKNAEQLEREKEEEVRAIKIEKERRFATEIDKSKANMNKMIEESIRDKKIID